MLSFCVMSYHVMSCHVITAFHPGDHLCNLAELKFQMHIYVHVPYANTTVLNNILLATFVTSL